MSLKHPFLWVSLATILALAGCGGGGGSDSSSNPSPDPNDNPPTTPGDGDDSDSGSDVTVSGVAVKGLLKGAKVTAYELDSTGKRLPDAVGTATTDANGAYELELADSYTGGVIEVEVSVVEGTKMVCDAARCGSAAQSEEIDLPADFTLSAIVEKPSSSNTVKASVTAWSTMAAKRAKTILAADANMSIKEAAEQANIEVSQVVGFDVAATESRGLSQIAEASAAQAQYAVMNAAVAEVLFQGSEGSDLTERLNIFTSALEDGVVGNADGVAMADLSSAVRQVAERVVLDDAASEAINNQTAQYDAAGDDGFAPEYDEDLAVDEGATQEEKIKAFQSFVSQARTWVSQVEALNPDTLTAAVDVDAAAVESILASQDQFAFVGLALDQVNAFIVENAVSVQSYITDGVKKEIAITDGAGASVGTATLTFVDDNGLSISVDGAVTGEGSTVYLPFSLVLDTSIAPDALVATAEADDGGVFVAVSVAKLMASTTMTLSGYVGDGEGSDPLTLNGVTVNLELSKALEADKILSEDINSHFESAALSGEVTVTNDQATFTGEVEAKLVKLVSGFGIKGIETSAISFKYFRIGGEFVTADGSHSFAASASLDIHNAATFDTFAWADFSGAEETFYADIDTSLLQALLPQEAVEASDWHLSVQGNVAEGLSFEGGYDSDGDGMWTYIEPRAATQAETALVVDAVRTVIAEEFAGNTELANDVELGWIGVGGDGNMGAAWMQAEVAFPDLETAENFMKASFSLSAKVDIPELRAAQVTTTLNRSSYRGGSVRANVKWDGGNYTVVASSDDFEAAETVNLRVFNAQGYELNMDISFDAEGSIEDLAGNALLNDEKVGAVEFREGAPVIVYPNGKEEIFESLY